MAERQSPVDIPPDAPVHRGGLELHYGPIPLVLGNNPLAVQVENTGSAGAVIAGVHLELVQLHLHCPSEHTFGGSRAAMELHLVHQSPEGQPAVVAVTYVEGRGNPALEAIIAALASEEAPSTLELAHLLPSDRAHVIYEGSLTMPPFTEGVAWYVLTHANTLSPTQLATLRACHDGNARPVQPMGARSFL